ncbi:MAG: amidohydrolase, partial [Clostridium sp.]|nr:amidohydrolase [Clostridium sp.]
MEKLYVNGSIHTLDAASPLVSALAAVDGRIVAIGTEAEVRAAVSPAAEVVDLGGRTVTPAFSD